MRPKPSRERSSGLVMWPSSSQIGFPFHAGWYASIVTTTKSRPQTRRHQVCESAMLFVACDKEIVDAFGCCQEPGMDRSETCETLTLERTAALFLLRVFFFDLRLMNTLSFLKCLRELALSNQEQMNYLSCTILTSQRHLPCRTPSPSWHRTRAAPCWEAASQNIL